MAKQKKKPVDKKPENQDESQLQKAASWVADALTPKSKKEN